MPRVYGNWPGNSSALFGRSFAVYSGWMGMPEIVEVSSESSRLVGLDSKSSFQTCLGSRARTFIASLHYLAPRTQRLRLEFAGILKRGRQGSPPRLRKACRQPPAAPPALGFR